MGLIEGETGTQRLIGYVLDVGAGDGRARCRLTLTDDHTNRHGALHGGIAVALLDNAMGATASLTIDESGRAPFLTVSMASQFLAPARAGDELEATGRVTGGGRSLVFIDGVLETEGGRTIATAQGVFKRVPPERLT
ncbi:PaaI family thioesterase [Jannaschia aquimarina]|uniref:Thioesterase superfamily protein n=1 Tax=Jannaschia aquimarina TaxID=935700 RepID=A0A0D1ELQ0_9RHOB|nr:PaaI family thioesterase [Jannaschia aquimarina]KIT17861.1 Thioesterase superfamily protein [Jannaschia aquimarina]SNS56200.1 uncharacterized domain 1-containing protein [Jannaschia aquimarina]